MSCGAVNLKTGEVLAVGQAGTQLPATTSCPPGPREQSARQNRSRCFLARPRVVCKRKRSQVLAVGQAYMQVPVTTSCPQLRVNKVLAKTGAVVFCQTEPERWGTSAKVAHWSQSDTRACSYLELPAAPSYA